jgi:HSP20 family protein
MKRDRNRLMHTLFLPAAGSLGEPYWHPAADVYRHPGGWIVKFDLAGVRPEELSVSVDGRVLTVRGCRRDHTSERAGHHHYRMEISYSCFERSVELPVSLDGLELTLEYQNGMLLVRIPKEDNR